MNAAQFGHIECMKVLLDRGAQVNFQGYVSTLSGQASCLVLMAARARGEGVIVRSCMGFCLTSTGVWQVLVRLY